MTWIRYKSANKYWEKETAPGSGTFAALDEWFPNPVLIGAVATAMSDSDLKLEVVGAAGKVGTFPTLGAVDFVALNNAGDAYFSIVSNSTAKGGIKFWKDASASVRARIEYDHNDDSLKFTLTGDSEKARIKSDGNFLIGTTTGDIGQTTLGRFTLMHTATPIMELGSSVADAAGALLGNFEFVWSTQGTGNRRMAAISAISRGATANNRGADLDIYTRPNAGALRQVASFLSVAGFSVDVGANLATNATDGFIYIPACAGTPTGVPTARTGAIPLVYDLTNNILYAYSNGAWRAH